jgi:hypothetical protein
MYRKSSPPIAAAVFSLVAAIIAQLVVFPIAAVASVQEQAGQPTITSPQQPAVQPTEGLVIPDGTEFTVVTTEELSSKTATEGDPLTFKVDADVKINDQIVIAKDSLVKGTVASAKKSGFFGRGGNLGIRIESAMTVDNQKLKLRSAKGKQGDDKTGTTVALVVLFGPLGFLKKGKQAIIKPGTQIKVYTDEEKKVQAKA